MTAGPKISGGAGQECELKLSLTATDYERLRTTLPGRRGEIKQHNSFWDTAEGRLASEHWALRLRRESGASQPARVIVTVKGPTTRVAGARHRTELQIDVDDSLWQRGLANTLRVEDIDGPPGEYLREELELRGPLCPVLEFTNLRTIFVVELAGAPRELELDRTDFATGERDHELELELAAGGDLSPAEMVLEVKAVWADLETLLAKQGISAIHSPSGKLSRALHYAKRR